MGSAILEFDLFSSKMFEDLKERLSKFAPCNSFD
jgi:hypothetical protein